MDNIHLDYIKKSALLTELLFLDLDSVLKIGMDNCYISSFLHFQAKKMNLSLSWDPDLCPNIRIGHSFLSHNNIIKRRIDNNMSVHIDFGVKFNGFCADLQRLWYFNDGKKEVPYEVYAAFDTVRTTFNKLIDYIMPGIKGYEADMIAREYIKSKGYRDYPFATGHLIGKAVHIPGVLLAPKKGKYSKESNLYIEEGQVLALELGVPTPYGWIGKEEMILVTEKGCEYISTPQEELWIK